MAITTYGNLQSAIGDWLARPDLTTAQLQNLISMFEAYANRKFRVRQMETSEQLTTTSGVAALASDYLSTRSLTWNGSTSRQLEYRHPDWFYGAHTDSGAGTPADYTIQGENIDIRPVDDTADGFTHRYYQKIPALSDSATTNWLLTAHPDAYLFGSLVEAQAFLVDAEKAILWKARRDEVCDEIIRLSNVSKVGPARPFGWIV
jgi:hypothetical protein